MRISLGFFALDGEGAMIRDYPPVMKRRVGMQMKILEKVGVKDAVCICMCEELHTDLKEGEVMSGCTVVTTVIGKQNKYKMEHLRKVERRCWL